MSTLRRGIGRLIDSYAESIIDKAEFEPRIAGLKQRLSQLQDRHRAAIEVAENERDLSLLISRLEDFSAKVATGLAGLNRTDMREIIRTVVRRIEIDEDGIEIVFRVPPLDGPVGPASPSRIPTSTQHCTAVDHPSAWQDGKADLIRWLPDDFDEDVGGALMIVAAIGPYM